MKNVLRIAAVVLPLVCGANIAMAQAILEDAIVTGSEDNTREFLGLPPLEGHSNIPAVSAGTETTSTGGTRRPRRTTRGDPRAPSASVQRADTGHATTRDRRRSTGG